MRIAVDTEMGAEALESLSAFCLQKMTEYWQAAKLKEHFFVADLGGLALVAIDALKEGGTLKNWIDLGETSEQERAEILPFATLMQTEAQAAGNGPAGEFFGSIVKLLQEEQSTRAELERIYTLQ